MTHRPDELGASGGSTDGRIGRDPTSASALGTVRAVARAERNRYRHRYTASRRRQGVVLLAVALLLPAFGWTLRAVYGLGRRAGRGDVPGLLELAMWSVPMMVGTYALLGAAQADSRLLNFEARKLLLTTVEQRTLVFGLLLAEVSSWVLLYAGPLAVVVAVFALGAGSPTAMVVGTTAAVLLTVAALLWGYVLGLAGRLVWRRQVRTAVPRSAFQVVWLVVLGLAFGIGGVYAGSIAGRLEGGVTVAAVAPAGPPPIPLGRYAEFALLDTPLVTAVSGVALASGVAVVAAIPLGAEATARVAPRLWYADAPASQPDEETADSGGRAATGNRRRRPWSALPSGYVADGVVRRAVRTPTKWIHVSYYVLALGVLVATSIAEPALLPTLLGWASVLFGVWLAGGAFGLNPIGEEGAMLGQIVLSEFRPHTFVRARILSGTVVGVPFVLAGTAILALDAPSTDAVLVAGGFWLALTPVSAAVAVGVGTLLPRTEPGRVLDLDAVTPKPLAVIVHGAVTAALSVTGGGIALGAFGRRVGPLALGVVALSAVLAADLCYRFAVAGVASYGRSPRRSVPYVLELVTAVSLLGLVLSITVPAGAEALLSPSGPVGRAVSGIGAAVGWAMATLAYLFASDRPRAELNLGIPDRDAVGAVGVGAVTAVAVAGGIGLLGVPHAPFPTASLRSWSPGVGGTVGLLALSVIALLHAASLELLFRGVVQRRVSEVATTRSAILVAGALFTAVHVPLAIGIDLAPAGVTLGSLFVLSLVWGWLYRRSGSVLVPMLSHGCFGIALLVA